MSFIENPNLPDLPVSTLICGSADEKVLSFFSDRGIRVLSPARNLEIAEPVSCHADMACLHLGGRKIIVDKKQKKLKEAVEKIGMTAYETVESVKGKYPSDVSLNVALTDNFAIGCFRYTDRKLLELLKSKAMINVNQGYCKCSVLLLNSDAAITDDESIFHALRNFGIDCLLIAKGDIALEGYDYGFIGGASGKISSDTVVFFGNIEKHRDFLSIREFLKKHGCRYVCTDDAPLRDIGGIITLTHEDVSDC